MGASEGGREGAVAVEAADPSSSSISAPPLASTKTRVYVGGLSGAVTAADVEKTFSSLGKVSSVEFVRTKGRNFAFMDFEPKSDKSYARLFASYNGCIWKGGKLRLEKAKEHYLDHLRQEWTEDAELMSGTPISLDTDKKLNSSDKSNCVTQEISSTKLESMTQEKMQLRIYFPKLRKVKPLFFRGTGKHKYSFQRTVVPPLPVHFCDCEEHNGPSEETGQNRLPSVKSEISVVNTEELSIMNSVLNKLLEEEANANAADRGASPTKERGILDHPNGETPLDEREADQETDEDNIVTNIGLGGNNDALNCMQLKVWETASEDQDLQVSRSGKHQTSIHGSTKEKQNRQKRQKTGIDCTSEATSTKKASHRPAGESEKGELPLAPEEMTGPECRGPGDSLGNAAVEVGTNQDAAVTVNQLAKGSSWIQKSAWKDLVGDTGNSTFRISNVLPGIDSAKQKSSKSVDAALVKPAAAAAAARCNKVVVTRPEGSYGSQLELLQVRRQLDPFGGIFKPRHKKEEEEASGRGDGLPAIPEERDEVKVHTEQRDGETRTVVTGIGIGQVCTFTRSSASEREWTKAKAVLGGHLRRKMKESSSKENIA